MTGQTDRKRPITKDQGTTLSMIAAMLNRLRADLQCGAAEQTLNVLRVVDLYLENLH